MKPAELVEVVVVITIAAAILAAVLGLDPDAVVQLGVRVLLWLLPGAIFAAVAEAVADGFVGALPRGLPAGVIGVVWTVLYWGTRLYLIVEN